MTERPRLLNQGKAREVAKYSLFVHFILHIVRSTHDVVCEFARNKVAQKHLARTSLSSGSRHEINVLGPFQTSNFTCAKSNANEKNLLFSLICIRFGTCKVRRLKRALQKFMSLD